MGNFFVQATFKCPICGFQNKDVILNEAIEGNSHQFYYCSDPQDGGCGAEIILEADVSVKLIAHPIPGKIY